MKVPRKVRNACQQAETHVAANTVETGILGGGLLTLAAVGIQAYGYREIFIFHDCVRSTRFASLVPLIADTHSHYQHGIEDGTIR